jgi:chemotaxis protein methyltransferase CheR
MKVLKSSEVDISDELFLLFSELIYKSSGIKLGLQKKGLLISRLAKRLRKLEIGDFYEYYKIVSSDNEELTEMLNCIATNITKFFRESYHFVYLKNIVIPELLEKRSDRKIMRIWSAGCSTGEEPYSIAITIHEALTEHFIKFEEWDIRVLATDISTRALETASAGVYEYEQLPDDMPESLVRRYFLKGTGLNEGKIMVKDFIREMVSFRRFNLKEPRYPFRRPFDIIFCKNVMIYFDENMKQHVLSRFYRHLSDRGYLFLGHSESMVNSKEFRPVYITVYKKV